MAKSKKVSSLIEEKRKISKEIESLQNKCIHLQKSIKSIREDNTGSSLFTGVQRSPGGNLFSTCFKCISLSCSI